MPTIPVNRTAHSRNLTFHDLFEGNEREPEERLESRTNLGAVKLVVKRCIQIAAEPTSERLRRHQAGIMLTPARTGGGLKSPLHRASCYNKRSRDYVEDRG